MYFKSLELIGFKSFAEKTKLNFEPGVTAIVGPNGCGKSNVADGIRWVLGEQSAKSLRASSMEDVIFNGTDNKDPINFAEVLLTLSNEKRILPIDYDEVTISRRVFRSGESEYLLNKTPVRLKDISDLLMGTGIGTESYSIIEQGKMDLVLSSKPEDRRYVFEEASGITKYKSQKKEALRKLEQTEQNLLRINDIIQEVKRQISSIERQARKAEKYKVDFDKLKEMEIKLSYIEFKNLKTQEATLSVENGDQRQREKDLDAENKTVYSKIGEYRQSLDELNKKISDLKTRAAEITSSLDMNTHKIEIDKERIEESHLAQGNLKKEIESINEKILNAKDIVEKIKANLEKLDQDRISKQDAVREREFLLNNLSKEIEGIDLKVKTCKVQTIDYIAKQTKIKNDLIKLGADIQNRKARQRRLDIEKDTVRKELDELEKALQNVLKEFQKAETGLFSLKSDLELKTKEESALALEVKAVEEGLAGEENNKTAIKSKIEFLEDLVKKHEGFKSGVKTLLVKAEEDRKSFGGILGVLADLLKVERGYEEAVSTFLGDDAQTIVVETDNDIRQAIGYLEENKLGKASFVSLETLKRLNGLSRPTNISVKYTPLANFIKINREFEAVITHFFADTYLVNSLEDGLGDMELSRRATLITKSGMMSSRGRVTGGSASERDEALLIGRRDRLESLRVDVKNLEEKTRRLNEELKRKNESASSVKGKVKTLEESIRTGEINVANIKMRKEAEEDKRNKLKDELQVAGLELDEVNQTIDELTQKGQELNTELNNIEKESASAQLFIDESQNLIYDKRSKKERLTLEIATLKAEGQSLEKEEENLKSNLKKEESILFESEEALYSKTNLLNEAVEKANALEEEIVSLNGQNEEAAKELRALEEKLTVLEKSKSDTVDKLGINEIQLKEKEREVEFLRNQIRDLDVKLTELNYKKTNLKERMNQAYKVDLESVHMELEDNIDRDTLRAQVAELKEKLDKIGPVNLVAIDEHKELEERYAFLVHQQEDLVNAKESLHKAIQKINKTTKELFLETFQKIQIEFKNFFRLLFGGGQAELVLIDDQDILESGIEIIVRPPGKKLQNMMLLSGGEKALTAIALLFAIFKVKPSPFCVLDEIDAPLDESNINRFSNVLKDFLKISQFIIITHNKRTIELADVMYGITMQERGVSKVVSVKFLDETKKVAEKVEAVA